MENQTLVKEICPTTTQEWIKNGAIIVDVREVSFTKKTIQFLNISLK